MPYNIMLHDHAYVYAIWAANRSRVYIGSSSRHPRYRLACHRHCALSGKMPTLAVLYEVGEPVLEILEEHQLITGEMLRDREQSFIDRYGGIVVNKNRAKWDQEAYKQRQKTDMICPSCGKTVQKVYLNQHMRNIKCREAELFSTIKAFGRFPIEPSRKRQPNNANKVAENAQEAP